MFENIKSPTCLRANRALMLVTLTAIVTLDLVLIPGYWLATVPLAFVTTIHIFEATDKIFDARDPARHVSNTLAFILGIPMVLALFVIAHDLNGRHLADWTPFLVPVGFGGATCLMFVLKPALFLFARAGTAFYRLLRRAAAVRALFGDITPPRLDPGRMAARLLNAPNAHATPRLDIVRTRLADLGVPVDMRGFRGALEGLPARRRGVPERRRDRPAGRVTRGEPRAAGLRSAPRSPSRKERRS